MLQKHKILILSAALCTVAAWYVRLQNPSFTYAPIITVSVIVATVYVYYATTNPTGECKSTSVNGKVGDGGACELDSDCNKVDPNGQCYKNAVGVCGCRCGQGYSGSTCQIKGIPWNDPGCMGPNKQSPKNKSGLCVCPNENWVSGTDPKYGQVQCLKCGGEGPNEWGPYAATGAPNACSAQWKQVNLLSDTCVYRQTTTPSLYCADVAAQYQTGYPNYKGDVPTVTYSQQGCIGASCKCAGNTFEYKVPSERALCTVNGWVDPSVNTQTCADKSVNTERACSGYECKGWTG